MPLQPRVSISGVRPRGRSWRVRWRIEGVQHERSFRTKAIADRFRRHLHDAVDGGASFDRRTGEPAAWGPTAMPTVAAWAHSWFAGRWDDRAAKTRNSDAEIVVDVVVGTLLQEAPDGTDVRGWARKVLCRRPGEPEPEFDTTSLLRGGVHIERWSPRLDEIDGDAARKLWTALGRRLDGDRAAASTTNRRRTLATKIFDDAVRAGHLKLNPLRQIDRPRRRHAHAVDPTRLPRPAEAAELIERIGTRGDTGQRAQAYLETILFSGCRPAEAMGLVPQDISRRSGSDWGVISFRRGRTQSTRAFTDTGEAWDEREALKWRAEGTIRAVDIPPVLVERIEAHIERWGTAEDGRIFVNAGGTAISSGLSPIWREAVDEVWPEGHPFNGLRPYDLRHIHATALLTEGVTPMRVAQRLGHSVEVLFRTYAGLFEDSDDKERALVAEALEQS